MSIYHTPTYLYIKQHNITGLKYFGKTIRKDPTKYKGSGVYWTNHLRKHSNNVTTIWYQLFESKEDLIDFSHLFSEMFNIVELANWANLCMENGTDGGYRENNHLRIYNTKPRKKSHGKAISNAKKGKTPSAESTNKRKITQAGMFKGIPKPLIICRLSDRKEMSASAFALYIRYLK